MSTNRHRWAAAVATVALGSTLAATDVASPTAAANAATRAASVDRTAAPALFGDAPAAVARQAADTTLGTPKRSRYVSFDAGAVPARAGQRVSLPYFSDASFVGRVERVDHQRLFTSWSGSLDTAHGSFVITRTGSRFSATAFTTEGAYTMQMTRSGQYQVAQADPASPTEADTAPVPAASTARGTAERRKHHTVRGGDDGSVEDILVVYTAEALAAYGPDGIQAEAARDVGYTNTAYADSGVRTTIRLVGVLPVSGTEVGGSLGDDLVRLGKRGDGYFDEAFRGRKQTHADAVILLEKPLVFGADANCGLANEVRNQPFASSFAVIATGACTDGNPAFAHELGHLQGALHDYYAEHDGGAGDNGGKPQYPYGYGYLAPDCSFKTIMAYGDQCLAQGLPDPAVLLHFSNPDVSYNGQTTGTAARSDVAKLITRTSKRMASHQQSTLYLRGKLAIKPAPRFRHGRVHVVFRGWVNPGVKTRFRWYRDGKKIKGAHGRTYRPTRKDVGHRLSVVVTGKKATYAPVTIGSKSRKVPGHPR